MLDNPLRNDYAAGKAKGRDFIKDDNFDDEALAIFEDEARRVLQEKDTSSFTKGYCDGVLERISERKAGS